MSFLKNILGSSEEKNSFNLPQGIDANIGLISTLIQNVWLMQSKAGVVLTSK